MQIIGIVVEYNPFHNGHFHQIEQIRTKYPECAIVVVMSGHFSQRGLPCVLDKYTRAEMALACGVDLVLELPTVYATASAERFSEAAINTLHLSGIVDILSFGSETPDLTFMKQLASLFVEEPPFVSSRIQTYLQEGESYPRARLLGIKDYFTSYTKDIKSSAQLEVFLAQPNNILSIEYLKALQRFNTTIEPFPIQRQVAGYHDLTLKGSIASATAIRHHLAQGNGLQAEQAMPLEAFRRFTQATPKAFSLDDYTQLFHYKIIMSNLESLYAVWDIPNNLCRSLYHASQTLMPLSQIVEQVTSKTYTRATVQRAILRILLDVKQKDLEQIQEIGWIPYIHVLGCNKTSTHLLSELSQKAKVPLLLNVGKDQAKLTPLGEKLFKYELRASKLYALLTHDTSILNKDFTYHPIRR
ncbi:MAG: nucleotidyltransferase family protein [Niameybacter sp.]